MYFKLNTLRLCKNLLKWVARCSTSVLLNCAHAHIIITRPVESRGIHESGTQGEMVTYRYYVGRLNMFEDQYDMAEKNFDYALRHCHRSAVANKKRILNYLVPVKLLRGRLPTSKCKYCGRLVQSWCIILLIAPVAVLKNPLLFVLSFPFQCYTNIHFMNLSHCRMGWERAI